MRPCAFRPIEWFGDIQKFGWEPAISILRQAVDAAHPPECKA